MKQAGRTTLLPVHMACVTYGAIRREKNVGADTHGVRGALYDISSSVFFFAFSFGEERIAIAA
jgi:hypothetical protein